MKKLLTFLMLLPCLVFAQANDEPGSAFSLQDGVVTFSKVYTSDKPNDELMADLELFLNNLGGFDIKRNGITSDQINGTLKESTVNYRKYGGSFMMTNIVLNSPFDANVIIQAKDNRYRVIVTNIIFKNVPNAFNNNLLDFTLEDLVTKRKRTEFRNSSEVVKMVNYTAQHLSDLFDMTKVIDQADDW